MPRQPRFTAIHLILLCFAALAFLYAWAVPIFESPDESTHMAVIDYIASTGELPVQVVGQETAWAQEGSQPPLYFMLGAPIAHLFDRGDFSDLLMVNPHAIIGNPGADGNKNHFLHDSVYPPSVSGTAGAVYALRLFSIALSTVTVWCVYQSVRVILPDRPRVALLAAGLTAFNPQFIFISASVNNDNLVTVLNSLIFWQTLLMLRDGFRARRSLVIAILVALATISKVSGWTLAPVVALSGLWIALRSRDWRGLVTLAALGIAVWLLLGSWWIVRNLTLYHELLGTQTMLDIFGRRPAPTLIDLFRNEFDGLRISYWGLFGWFNVFTIHVFYVIMDVVSAGGAVGLLIFLWQQIRQRDSQSQSATRIAMIAALVLGLSIGAVSLIAWTMQTAASQGRLLFPFIVAISGLLAIGLSTLRISERLGVVFLGVFALVVPFVTLIPTYAPPPPLTELPSTATPAHLVYGDVELEGYEIHPRRYSAGDTVPITLYWRPLRQSDQDFSLFIRLVDADDQVLTALPTFPGYGRMRTTTWEPGAIYADTYAPKLPDLLTGAFGLRAYVGWWKFPDGYSIDPTDESGQPINLVFLDVGAYVNTIDTPDPDHAVAPVSFGGMISLVGYSLDGDVLSLLWQVTGVPDADYTVMAVAFAHPLTPGEDNRIVAQGDSPPDLPTHYWQSGDHFITHHTLTQAEPLMPGSYPVYVGWYNLATMQRLPTDAPDNAYRLTDLTIS